jgi:hypothetical protein
MGTDLSDERVKELWAERKQRQWLLFLIAAPASIVWLFVGSALFGAIVKASPSLNSPITFGALLLPPYVVFGVVATRFTRKNLRCPSCDHAIALYFTRYYSRGFKCPHCQRALA